MACTSLTTSHKKKNNNNNNNNKSNILITDTVFSTLNEDEEARF